MVDSSISEVTRVIYNEARGEGKEGMAAVAAVIQNRTKTVGFPSTPYEVVSRAKQFDGFKIPLKISGPAAQPAYDHCLMLATKITNEDAYLDIASGRATFFAASKTAFDSWGKGKRVFRKKIRNHYFFKATTDKPK